ncbi:hypothetical protein ACRE1U_00330 [Helicobacter himalayensis]|uniref:hypothetical protein n=1 Tax=Helicobacter himalayensis TaxID=1591088 RepID=UPI003D6F63B4
MEVDSNQPKALQNPQTQSAKKHRLCARSGGGAGFTPAQTIQSKGVDSKITK